MTKPKANPEVTGAAVVPFQPKSMLQVIAEATMNPAVDVAKMQAIMDMQMKLEAEEARKTFIRDLVALQSELPTISKDGLIDHGTGKQKSRYATYPGLMDVVGPLLRKYGFSFTSAVEPGEGTGIYVVSYLEHGSGHSRVSRRPLVRDTSGSKNEAQSVGSGQQYGMRYNLIALLNIVSRAPQDDCNDGYAAKQQVKPKPKAEPESDFPGDRPMEKDDPISSGRVINAKEFEKLVGVMHDCGVSDKAVLDKYRIKMLKQLPASMLEAAIAACKDYAKKKAAKS